MMNKLKKNYMMVGNGEDNYSVLEKKIKKYTKEKSLKLKNSNLFLENNEESSLNVIRVSSISIIQIQC